MTNLKRIREMLSKLPQDAAKANRRPYLEKRVWRGQEQFCAGYSWTRPGAHPITGRIYDTVLGADPAAEAAIDRMAARLQHA